MQKYISADWVFPVSSSPIRNGIIGVSADGSITAVLTPEQAAHLSITADHFYSGALIPGLINTHCHLELSHMRAQIEQKTGLPNFIKSILANRQQNEAEIIEAMQLADEEMYNNGIVAVGDISNLLLSKSVKLDSKIYYHTFVEVFGFNGPAQASIQAGVRLKEDFLPLRSSVVPHAPYSVSSDLFEAINEVTTPNDILSIHNQETEGENNLFETGTGKFADFFAELGIAQSDQHGTNRKSIAYHLPKLPKNNNVLLVHNTMCDEEDLRFAHATHPHLYWCLCPNANLYIEDTLPQVSLFEKAEATITLGTDSLASNHKLSVLSEMKTLQDHQNIPFKRSLNWATLNGAIFLKKEDELGSLEIGKKPGILWVNLKDDLKITEHTTIKRLY